MILRLKISSYLLLSGEHSLNSAYPLFSHVHAGIPRCGTYRHCFRSLCTDMHMQQEVLCTYCVLLYYRKGMYIVLSSDVVIVERLPRLGLVLYFLVDST